MSLLVSPDRIALRLPGAAVPEEHRAAAVFAGRDDPLELAVIERMILDVNGEPPLLRVEARPFRHRPALQHAVQFETEIVVQAPRRVLLDDEGQPGLPSPPDSAGRL